MRKMRGRLVWLAIICGWTLAAAAAEPEERRTMSRRWSVDAAYPQFHEDFLRKNPPSPLEDGEIANLCGGGWFRDGSAPTRENYSCLTLSPNGVTVHFQEYQVLPYAFGMPEYVVALEQLAPAEPNRKIWSDPLHTR